jgi:hypothetical protein
MYCSNTCYISGICSMDSLSTSCRSMGRLCSLRCLITSIKSFDSRRPFFLPLRVATFQLLMVNVRVRPYVRGTSYM